MAILARREFPTMFRCLLTTALAGLATCCAAAEPADRLPKPKYRVEASDPAWLPQAVQFHGHLGPWAAAGLRVGMAGRRAVDAEGYFDVEIVAEGPFVKPPISFFLDGLQVSTGATWGKRNLDWVKKERSDFVVCVKNTRTGKTAEIRPTPALLTMMTSFQPKPLTGKPAKDLDQDHPGGDDPLEAIARRIATLPEKEILTIRIRQ
jgi:hypothetical protein